MAVQATDPLSNPDLTGQPNYYLVMAILVGAAMLSHGVTMVARAWEKELGLAQWFSVVAQAFGIILATSAGYLVGHLVWDPTLAGVIAMVGAFSNALVLSAVRARIGRR